MEKILLLDASTISATEAPYDLVRRMRVFLLVMGPLLARKGEARIALPGGCAIGARPVDLHLKGFEALGATIIQDAGFVEAKSSKQLEVTLSSLTSQVLGVLKT